MIDSHNLIKLIIFDLDGVLINSKDIHYHALNDSLKYSGNEKYIISYEEHLEKYDGNPTRYKLNLLSKEKGLPTSLHKQIHELKQHYTYERISNSFQPDNRIINILSQLKKHNYIIYCASNSLWKTIKTSLLKKGFLEYIDYFISNEDVINPKPHPEMFLKCMKKAKCLKSETLIIEDSNVGIEAATKSGANVWRINSPDDLSLLKIYNLILKVQQKKYNENEFKQQIIINEKCLKTT
jgi:HAD superfamily hydrolase (TIGR01509 family)